MDHIKREADARGLTTLTTALGSFPEQLTFPEKSFQKILISRVLHFFTGEQIESAIQVAYKWLKPGGKLYIVCETPFLQNWSSFLPEYERRKRESVEYPGEITNPKSWENNRTDNLPDFVHWLDKETLEKLVVSSGLAICESGYVDRKGQFPPDLLSEGRESVGIIGRK